MVANADVVRTLERIADLLEIKGENPFKSRSYRLAAAQVENLSEELTAILDREGSLDPIEGFGPAISEKMTVLLRTGRSPYLEQLEAEIPPTLLQVIGLPGVGPRTAATLWKEAGITTLDDLEEACRSGRLAGLPRMGAKTVEKILAACEAQRETGGKQRRPRDLVAPLVETLLGGLRSLPAAQRAEVAGSFRRGRDTVGDLDLLVATTAPRDALVGFAALPQVERVLLRGDTKRSVVVDGMQVDCRAVAPEQFGAAWQYFTGSQNHNIRLRGMALRLGLTLNEYGVFRVDDGSRVAGETEEDVYRALGLRWIPPEQREDRGEVEAARIVPAGVASQEDVER
ncbi:MAG TPA: helix-hairpin-helix domain-containing protein [Candidatus Dormibacteraeota bacterium]|nr:helix-hairpin-helix domain-containing protein [Candidatus Dormibacteraeota bacterium]